MAKDMLVTTETLKAILPFIDDKISVLDADVNYLKDNAVEGTLLYTSQTLTDEQKEQARENIGAAADGDVGTAVLYTSQDLTDEQKIQARNNIGAATLGDMGTAVLYTFQTLTDEQKLQARNNIGAAALALSSTRVTLTSSGWSELYPYTQTVTVNGVSADEMAQLIIPSPASSNSIVYYNCGILCSGQGANQLTFTSEIRPSSDLLVYVMIQGA